MFYLCSSSWKVRSWDTVQKKECLKRDCSKLFKEIFIEKNGSGWHMFQPSYSHHLLHLGSSQLGSSFIALNCINMYMYSPFPTRNVYSPFPARNMYSPSQLGTRRIEIWRWGHMAGRRWESPKCAGLLGLQSQTSLWNSWECIFFGKVLE